MVLDYACGVNSLEFHAGTIFRGINMPTEVKLLHANNAQGVIRVRAITKSKMWLKRGSTYPSVSARKALISQRERERAAWGHELHREDEARAQTVAGRPTWHVRRSAVPTYFNLILLPSSEMSPNAPPQSSANGADLLLRCAASAALMAPS